MTPASKRTARARLTMSTRRLRGDVGTKLANGHMRGQKERERKKERKKERKRKRGRKKEREEKREERRKTKKKGASCQIHQTPCALLKEMEMEMEMYEDREREKAGFGRE